MVRDQPKAETMSAAASEYTERLNLADLVGRIERQQAETRKFVEEQQKLAAEREKLAAEREKLNAEALKIARDRGLAPLLAAGAMAGAAAAVGGALLVPVLRALGFLQ